MKPFSENLADFQKSMNFSDSDIKELANLTEGELEDLQYDDADPKLLYKFCINTEVDFTSIYSDKGFQTANLFTQFSQYPDDYKKIVTKHLCKGLTKKFKFQGELKSAIKESIPDHDRLVTRFFSGNSLISEEHLPAIKSAVSGRISEGEFDLLLGTIMFSKIPNYNYNVTRNYFNISYQQISDLLGISTSGVSNWGGLFCMKISEEYISKLAQALGGFSSEEFTTQFLNSKQLKGRPCSLSLGAQLPEPPSRSQRDKGEISQIFESNRYIDNKDSTLRSSENTGSQKEEMTTSMFITDDRTIKMFNNLNEENKQKVSTLIADLFFSQL